MASDGNVSYRRHWEIKPFHVPEMSPLEHVPKPGKFTTFVRNLSLSTAWFVFHGCALVRKGDLRILVQVHEYFCPNDNAIAPRLQ